MKMLIRAAIAGLVIGFSLACGGGEAEDTAVEKDAKAKGKKSKGKAKAKSKKSKGKAKGKGKKKH
jgi:hypothetical protein